MTSVNKYWFFYKLQSNRKDASFIHVVFLKRCILSAFGQTYIWVNGAIYSYIYNNKYYYKLPLQQWYSPPYAIWNGSSFLYIKRKPNVHVYKVHVYNCKHCRLPILLKVSFTKNAACVYFICLLLHADCY